MADKFFIATCEKKVSKHPIKDGLKLTLPVKAGTQTEAKDLIRKEVEALDPSFEGKSETYNDWYKVPSLEKVSEEEYNAEVLKREASTPNSDGSEVREEIQEDLIEHKYPTLGKDGFFDTKDPAVEESSFIYKSTDESMQAAKVFILNVGPNKWSYGFRYLSGDFDKHEKMNLDRVVEKRSNAIDASISRLENFLDYQDEFGDDSQKPFLSAVMGHDFYIEFMEPCEKFVEAVANHPNSVDSIEKHEDFLEVVESHFADIWPLDKSPDQAIEHINSMQLIDVIYDIDVMREILKPYLPIVLTEKTKESMKHIEEVIDKPAANDDSLIEPCWKAALPVKDDLHVVLAIKDCGDKGWSTAFEGNLKQERVFGDANDFGDEYSATRKEAIKFAAGQATNALYSYDTTLSLAKVFMKSPYLQDFEENCVEIFAEQEPSEIEYEDIYDAIVERLGKRIAETTAGEPMLCYNAITAHVSDETDIKLLVKKISSTPKCNVLFIDSLAKDFVERCSKSSQENKPQENIPTNEPKESSAEESDVKSGSENEPDNVVDAPEPDNSCDGDDVSQDILNKEPANEPINVPSVELEDDNPNMNIWNQAFKTDLNFTKQDPSTGRLSINAQYRQMQATKIFGARGKGWGVEVKREWIEEGMPIFANGAYTGVNESVHNIEIELWYIHPDSGERCAIPAFGETERFYWSHNYSRMIKNGECRKKSLTDATGKALSMLGICGDVYMGEYDDDHIISRSQATKMTGDRIKQLEFDAHTTQQALDKAKSYADKFKTAPSLAEIKRLQKLAETALDAIPTQDDASKAKKDKAIARVSEQAEAAIKDFNSDIKGKDQANG